MTTRPTPSSRSLLAALLLGLVAGHALAAELPRRGSIGVAATPSESGGVTLTTIRPGGAADKAGLRVGDEVLSIAGESVATTDGFVAALRKAPAGRPVDFSIRRGGEATTVAVTPDPLGSETVPKSTVTYSSVTVPAGYRLRTIVTEPEDRSKKHPAFMFVQGIYCASLDRPQAPQAVDTRLVHDLAAAGFVTLRVDKPGLGDSEGPPCGDINFDTELAGYAAALKQLKSLPSVDPDRVFIFGHSMGGVMAPYLAGEVPIRGAIVYGTLARTWLEYSLENARRQSELQGVAPGMVTQIVQRQSELLAPVLVDKKTLAEVWEKRPELKPPPGDTTLEATRIYGRHVGFYHQLQDLNLANAWSGVETNVLALHGEYDWVVSEADHRTIAQLVNARAPGKGTFRTLPKADHGFTVHDSLDASLRAMGRGEWDGSLSRAVLDWIKEVDAAPAQAKPAEPKAGATRPAAAAPASSAPVLAAGERPAQPEPAAKSDAKPATGRAALPASTTAWTRLKTEAYPGKQDDLFFVSPTTGWYANGAGKIFKTTDAGQTWTEQLHTPGTFFRCLAFLDENTGFAGNIGPGYFPNVTDTTPLYTTTDGGKTWTPVTAIDGPPIVGLCAIEVVKVPFVNAGNLDHRTRLVAVGRVGGPAAMIVSDDQGKTWQRVDLPSSAAMAFDVHFFDDKHGLVASATDANVADSRPLILATDDGGKTWREAYTGQRPFELTWKISFPTREVGYVTIQSYNPDPKASPRYVAKTTDGGKTWNEIPLVDDHRVRQFGVAFVDENRGWVGAMPGGFETTDGGKTWLRADFGNAVNKIRVLRAADATHLFAIGVNVSTLAIPAAR